MSSDDLDPIINMFDELNKYLCLEQNIKGLVGMAIDISENPYIRIQVENLSTKNEILSQLSDDHLCYVKFTIIDKPRDENNKRRIDIFGPFRRWIDRNFPSDVELQQSYIKDLEEDISTTEFDLQQLKVRLSYAQYELRMMKSEDDY